MSLIKNENAQAKEAWDRNAAFWNERMGEGNDFFNVLLWPAVERLLQPRPRERLLDVACGNGLTSRRLAAAKARVTAFDISSAMVTIAAGHPDKLNIDYRVLDATDRDALLGLGTAVFDGALCNMALMDMADVEPLMIAMAVLLKPGGRFVFSSLHPCFNNPATVQMGELEDRNGAIVTAYSVKIARYKTPFTQVGLAMQDQPVPHPYFHRPSARCSRRRLLLASFWTESRSKPSLPTTPVARHHCHGMAASVRFQQRSLFGCGASHELLLAAFRRF